MPVVDNGDEGDGGDDEEPEPREAWALDRLCDALLVKGALVPISRKLVIGVFLPPPNIHIHIHISPLQPTRGSQERNAY